MPEDNKQQNTSNNLESESLEANQGPPPDTETANVLITSSKAASREDETKAGKVTTGGKKNSPATPQTNQGPKKPSGWRQIIEWSNLYLVIFVLIVGVAGAGLFIISRPQKQNTATTKNGVSLTDSQIAQLQGNTTVVGDPKQTLDVQGNSIFEGQILIKSDLNVAGSIKTGSGTLSVNSLSASGTANINQLQVNNTVSIGGNATLTGQLNVAKNIVVAGSGSFGSVSTSTLSVSNLQFSGDLTINRHITANGSAPSRSNGSAIGNGGTTSVSGNDITGTININTGTGTSAGSLISLTFANKFAATPHIVVTPIGSAAAVLQYYITRTNTGFTLYTLNAPPASQSFSFDYIVIN